MRLKPLVYGILAIALFWGSIGGAMATGLWVTKQSLPKGSYIQNSEDIKGWMTLEDISKVTKIPLKDIKSKMKLPENADPNISIKELSAQQGVSSDELKELLFGD